LYWLVHLIKNKKNIAKGERAMSDGTLLTKLIYDVFSRSSGKKDVVLPRQITLSEMFNLKNSADIKLWVMRAIKNAITFYMPSDESSIEAFRKSLKAKFERVGKIFNDVDRLKAVNRLGGHENGSLLLCKIVNVLCNNHRVAEYINKWHLETVMIAREGGDEFGVLLLSPAYPLNQSIDQLNEDSLSILEGLRSIIVDEVEKIETCDILDLSSEKVQKALSPISQELFKKIGSIPKFTASISPGTSTLWEAYLEFSAKLEEKIKANEPLDFKDDEIIQKLMGFFQDIADEKQKITKALYSQICIDSDSPYLQFYASLGCRDPYAEMLFQSNMEKDGIIKEKDKTIEEKNSVIEELLKQIKTLKQKPI